MELHQTIGTCQWSLGGLNETAMQQKEIIQSLMDELDFLEGECFGKNRLHPEICSGHGDCVQVDQCVCESGWIGIQCQKERLTWEEIHSDPRPSRRSHHSLVEYQDCLWLYGGYDDVAYPNDVWMYDIKNSSWSQKAIGFGPPVRYVHTAVVYQDAMWVFGGSEYIDNVHNFKKDLWTFDFSTFFWNDKTSDQTPEKRIGHSAVVYQDAMWIFGGQGDTHLNDLWQFGFEFLSWNQSESAPQTRGGHAAVVYHDAMWIFGGNNGPDLFDALKFNFTSSVYEQVVVSGVAPVIKYSSAVVYQDAMWIFGWLSNDVSSDHQVSRFEFAQQSWEQIDTPDIAPASRNAHAGSLHQGMLWTFGGFSTFHHEDLWRFIL